MGLLDWILAAKKTRTSVPEGHCPNCWGRQEYEGRYIELARDRQIDINNHDAKATRAFIENFVIEHLSGIRLKKDGDRFICPKCKTGYKNVPNR